MKIREAIQVIKNRIAEGDNALMVSALLVAISVLEKQVGRKPDYQYEAIRKHMDIGLKAPFCSVCGADLLDDVNDCYEYCPECGQKIEWEAIE